MKIFKKRIIITSVIALTLIFSGLNINFSALKVNAEDELPGVFLTNQTNTTDSISTLVDSKSYKTKLNTISSVDKLSGSEKIIFVDGNLMNNSEVKEKLVKLFDKGANIVFRKDFLDEMTVINYFGLKPDGLAFCDVNENADLKRIGVEINKNSDGTFYITAINSENYTEQENLDLLYFSCINTFNDRIKGKSTKVSLFEPVKAYADWTSVNVASAVDGYNLVNVSWSIVLEKDTANPLTGGKYRSSRKSIVEATPKYTPAVQINDIHIWTDGGSSDGNWTSRVSDYAPKNNGGTDSNGNITFSIPWGVSFSSNLGSQTINYSTEAGGIGYGYVQVKFAPSSTYRDSRMSGCVSTDMYQDSSMNSDPSYFKSTLIYFVNNQNYVANPNTYYTDDATHTITGY